MHQAFVLVSDIFSEIAVPRQASGVYLPVLFTVLITHTGQCIIRANQIIVSEGSQLSGKMVPASAGDEIGIHCMFNVLLKRKQL